MRSPGPPSRVSASPQLPRRVVAAAARLCRALRHVRPVVLALLAGLIAVAGPARAQPARATDEAAADAAFHRRAAVCAAVLKPEVLRLAERWRAGDKAVRGEAQRLTELSFTFVGVAYKRGLRGEAADRLLAEAERAQAGQAPAALRQLSADCQAEARTLLDGSNVIERLLVRNRAKARVEHLLDDAPAAQRAGKG